MAPMRPMVKSRTPSTRAPTAASPCAIDDHRDKHANRVRNKITRIKATPEYQVRGRRAAKLVERREMDQLTELHEGGDRDGDQSTPA